MQLNLNKLFQLNDKKNLNNFYIDDDKIKRKRKINSKKKNRKENNKKKIQKRSDIFYDDLNFADDDENDLLKNKFSNDENNKYSTIQHFDKKKRFKENYLNKFKNSIEKETSKKQEEEDYDDLLERNKLTFDDYSSSNKMNLSSMDEKTKKTIDKTW